MAICAKCRKGFDTETSTKCPFCGAYWNQYPEPKVYQPTGAPVGRGPLWTTAVPFLLGVLFSLVLRSPSIIYLGTLGALLGLYLWSIFWSYDDAKARGKSGFLVAMLVILLGPAGLIAWLIFRP